MTSDFDLDWSDQGAPRSTKFGDIYFSAADGLAEKRAVFLRGCGLPEAWRDRSSFTVGELGFGTGLSVLALLDLWRRERPAGARLQVFSVEAYPLGAQAARRALARWPELSDLAETLLAQWPASTPGFHRLDFPELGATLDVAILEVEAALFAWRGKADAWFLDGFAPSANPDMWRPEVLRLVAERSQPGTRLASFTVAGEVRRGLEAQGFEVLRRPGFGRKRERLEAMVPGAALSTAKPGRLAIVGGGIAAAALARGFERAGASVVVVAPSDPGASGNPSALVTPRLDAGGGPVAAFFAQAFERAVTLYRREVPAAVIAEGVVQLEHQPRDAQRFDRIVLQDLWAPGAVLRLDAAEASVRVGEPVAQGGLWLRDTLAIEPAPVLEAWFAATERVRTEVGSFERSDGGWRLFDPEGDLIVEAEAVCLAPGWGLKRLVPDLPLSPVRGQASLARGAAIASAVAWGGYAAPAREGVLFGATHDRGEAATEFRGDDDGRNLQSLRGALPSLAARLETTEITGRAAVRATTPDRLPIAGPIGEGLFVLGGLGSRGFTTAPLLAEHVAALALGRPSPLSASFDRLVGLTRLPSRSPTA